MEGNQPFKPAGPVHFIPATPGGGSATKILGPSVGGEMNYLIVNPSGAPDLLLGYGPTSDLAVSNSATAPLIGGVAPTSGVAGAVHVPGGSIHVFTFFPGAFVAARSVLGMGSCTYSVTMGFGL